ncbi:hypothetical protein V8J88_02475 [Massilia sp. W12]|uniref:hypothetical protein n=1 Tax=Massilia sp. W12 TaxID=3126507 RepID=UPI0030CDB1A4
MLEHLAVIGQEMTALLDLPRIHACIEEHVFPLVQADLFSLLMLSPNGKYLKVALARRAGSGAITFAATRDRITCRSGG